MSPELVTAISSGIAALVVAASVFLTAWRTERKLEQQSSKQGSKLDEIHVLVNSRLSRALAQIATLQKQLGIEQEEDE